MCGICGYIDKSGCFDGSEFLKEMGSILAKYRDLIMRLIFRQIYRVVSPKIVYSDY